MRLAKNWLFWVVLLVIGFFCYNYAYNNNLLFDISSHNKLITNFEDLNKNPEKYINQELTLKGVYGEEVSFSQSFDKYLADKNGFKIYIDLSIDRDLKLSQNYKISGIFQKQDKKTIYFLKEN